MFKTKNVQKSEEKRTVEVVSVERYSNTHRLHHWVHVGSMIVFFITGLEIAIKVFFIGGYSLAQLTKTFHFTLGIFIGFWDLVFYLGLMIKDGKILEIFPTPREILDLFIILLCALRILPDEKYPHYDFYILEEEKYIMKYHPAQKLLVLSNLVVIFLMGVTGISLAEQTLPGSTGVLFILTFLLVPLEFLNLNIRFIHFLLFAYFILTTMIHFYFAIIPQNRQRLRGMVTGKENIPIR